MDVHWKLNKAGPQVLLCLVLLAASVAPYARAAGSFQANVKVVNETATPLVLSAANWVLGGVGVDNYAIPGHRTGDISLMFASKKRGALSFTYTAGDKSCTFKAGHDIRTSFGWFRPAEEPYQWTNAQSDGASKAICKAQLVSHDPDKSYSVRVSIE
ncbi:hypothetical protein [Pseudomonas folii]|uniref:Uncharacterized protein n=1 Tax=Pseudomonas folii TaxID=2762593 RepID=A0ABR7B6X7_9PSED|nr:hypothetical protein [Pseudomonas folii]MBC3952924.1 hypothetical protein [Pseudomonas folii]